MSEIKKGIKKFSNKPTKPTPEMRKNHLLVIGIDDYSNQIPKLKNAVLDAETVYNLLISEYQFETENAVLLRNGEATKDKILEIFDKLIDPKTGLSEQDNLVIYFSGHGEFHEPTDEGYWIPVDARKDKRGDYLPNGQIIKFLRACKAHHIFSIVDSCFSGAIFDERKTGNKKIPQERKPSRWILTSGLKEPVSDGREGKHSPFAEGLINQLKYHDNTPLTVLRLCTDVLESVAFNTENQSPAGEALRNAGHHGGQFVFYRKGYIHETYSSDNQEIKPTGQTKSVSGIAENKIQTEAPKPAAPKNLPELKAYLKLQLVQEGLENFFETINEIINPVSRLYNDFLLQQAQFNSTQKQVMQGTVDDRHSALTFNRIRQAMTFYIDKLREEDLKEGYFQQ